MKKILLCLILSLGLATLGATPAFALLTHDAIYHWQDGGTIITQSTPVYTLWKVGDPVGWDPINPNLGIDWIQVHEKCYDDGWFRWELILDNYEDIYSFHVRNIGIQDIRDDDVSDDDWTFSFDDDWFTWVTTTDPISGTGDSVTFRLQTYGSGEYGISIAGVDDGEGNWSSDTEEGAFWVASHPVPEPTSMLLLGIGLIGLAGKKVTKRFRA